MKQEKSHFFAYLSRMKLIDRWSLMRCTQSENIQEHCLQVAMVAHALAVIKNKHFGGITSPDRIALLAMFHDAPEVLTGDMPTPVKYFNGEMRSAYKAIEEHAASQLLALLPADLRDDYRDLLIEDEQDPETRAIIKSADNICAYIKCLEERSAGNHEFSRAQKAIEEKLRPLCDRHPEVRYFVETFIPSFSLTLDELSGPL